MTSSGNETVNLKEVATDVDETPNNINLNDALVEGEAKGPPLSHPGVQETKKSTKNGEMETDDKDNVTTDAFDNTVVEAEEQIPAEKVAEIPDVKSSETFVGDSGKAACDSNVQEHSHSVSDIQVNANGIHNEQEDAKLKSEDNVDDDVKLKSNEDDLDDDANLKSKEDDLDDDVKLKSEKDDLDDHMKLNPEDNVDDVGDEIIIDANAKENDGTQVYLLDNKSSPGKVVCDQKFEDDKSGKAMKDEVSEMFISPHSDIREQLPKIKLDEEHGTIVNTPSKSFLADLSSLEGYESGTEEEQASFAKEVETFYRENNLEYKAPKFYKEELNLLKLWRAVIKLGGYEQVTSCKLWRQVGESFRPPKTCTTVSWTFRIFYEKALLEYEKHKMRNGELPFTDDSLTEPIRVENQASGSQAFGSGRARRDAAARAMEGWHSQRLLGNGEVCQPIIKDKNLNSALKSDKQLKTNGLLKRKKPSNMERAVLVPHMKTMRTQMDSMVIDIGPPADWVKINVQRTNDCFEIYALVPGLLREEVHVQSDPAGRLIISGQPEQLDNPWGVAPFKKVVSLPSRIDPHQTSAVVTLHGQLFVRVPFEQSDI